MTTDTRTLLTSHALRLFLERGYEGTSLGDLIAASGLSKGAVYHHFRNKEDLFEAAIEQFFTRFLPAEPPSPGPQPDLRDSVTDMVERYCGMLAAVASATPDRLAYFRFLIAIAPRIAPQVRERLAMARRTIAAAATAEQATGHLPARVAPSDIADQCLALIEGSGLLAIIEASPEDAADALRRIVGRYLDGLYRP